MTATALPENYCVCVGEDGAPRELGRSGTAVTYKAMSYQSGRPVALQLIPLADVSEAGRAQFELKVRAVRKLKHPNVARVFDVREEDEHLVFATEFLQGETAERWVVTHGPMPPDAVVRIGLQVVSALAEAAFHSLSHRSIQPSNLMIISGAAPDGDWPFVKLLHFGLAEVKLYSDGKDLVPAIGAAFASPEQSEKGKVDFRSEIFSLGATMCFLLTGDVPLAGRAGKSGLGRRVLPSAALIPRPVRHLLRQMLRVNPDERPRDPLLLTDELRACLKKVQRRRALRRAANVPIERKLEHEVADNAEPGGPRTRPRFLFPILTGATVLLLLAAFGIILLPAQVRWWTRTSRPLESIGVPIGVDEAAPQHAKAEPGTSPASESSSPISTKPNDAVARETDQAIAEQPASLSSPTPGDIAPPEPSGAPVIAENSPAPSPATTSDTMDSSANDLQSPGAASFPSAAHQTEAPLPAEAPSVSPSVPPADDNQEPPPPTEGPPAIAPSPPPVTAAESPAMAEQESPSIQNDELPVIALSSPAGPKLPKTAKAVPSSRGGNKTLPRRRAIPTMRVNGAPARRVGVTAEGNWILRLPSGETIVAPPPPDTHDVPIISHRKVRKLPASPRTVPANNGVPVVVLPPEN